MTIRTLDNQIAIVTGAGSGIGQAISLDLAIKGAKVMLIGRGQEGLEDTKRMIEEQGGYSECYAADVTDKPLVDRVVEEIYTKHGQIDILINNAGNATAPIYGTKMSMEDFDSVMKTHIYGALYFVQACGEKMKKRQYGRIILMSSLAGVYGLTGQVNYATVKTGLVGMTYTLAKEFGPFGITVNALQPGIIETQMTAGPLSLAREQFVNATPVQRIGKTADVAYATSFFCSPEASFVTGVVMRVDGGYILNSGMDQLIMQICQQGEN